MRPQCFHCGKSLPKVREFTESRRFNEAAVFPLRKVKCYMTANMWLIKLQ